MTSPDEQRRRAFSGNVFPKVKPMQSTRKGISFDCRLFVSEETLRERQKLRQLKLEEDRPPPAAPRDIDADLSALSPCSQAISPVMELGSSWLERRLQSRRAAARVTVLQ